MISRYSPRLGYARQLLFLLAFAVAGYAVVGYTLLPVGALVHPDMRGGFGQREAVLYVHVFAAALALLLGPLQFWARLRSAWPVLHRWIGRAYLGIGVLAGGLSGLVLAATAHGGIAARLGFAGLAIAWLYTGVCALHAIRGGDVAAHRRWMLRNFSLSCAAIALRLYIPVAVLAGVEFSLAYPIIAWLCWVPNLLVVHLLERNLQRRQTGALPAQ